MDGWSANRACYGCADGRLLRLPPQRHAVFSRSWNWVVEKYMVVVRGPRNSAIFRKGDERLGGSFLRVAGVLYSRRMDEVIHVPEDTKVLTLARSTRTVGTEALFQNKGVRAVRPNEGLESIGDGAFAKSGLRAFAAPSSLRRVGRRAF